MIVTYHPSLNCLSKIISKNLYLLYINDEVKRVFSPKPIISFRGARKLCNSFVKAQIYPTESPVGLFKCGKNAGKHVKMSIKLETLLLLLRLRNEKPITD